MHLSGFVSFPFDSPEMHTDNTWIRSLQRAPCINVWLFSDAAIPIPQTRQNTFRIHGHWFHMRLRFICFDSLRVRHVYNIFHALHTLSHSLYISVCAVLCCAVMCSRRPSTHLSYVLFVVRSFSVVCAMMSVCFTSIFEFGMCDRTESPSIRLSNLIERRFCDTKMFLLIFGEEKKQQQHHIHTSK